MQTTRSNLARSKTSPADPVLARTTSTSSQHVLHSTNVPLSERDSIFATSYQGDTPVTSPHNPRKDPPNERAGLISQALQRHQLRQEQTSNDLGHPADQPYQLRDNSAAQTYDQEQSLPQHQSSFDHDAAMSASSLSTMPTTMTDMSMFFHTLPHTDLNRLPYPLTSQSDRHSLYDPQLPPALQRPVTPNLLNKPDSPNKTTAEDLQSSAHRSSYRAWRQGQGRMAGKSIAESQGRNLNSEDNDVDRKIDAKMPKIDPGLNVRSRKTSHYLGLFKDHDSEHDKRREKKDKAKHTEEQQNRDQQALSAINEYHENDHPAATGTLLPHLTLTGYTSDRASEVLPSIVVHDNQTADPVIDTDTTSTPLPTPSTFEKEAEQEPATTDNPEGRLAHQIPPSLLEEIRNHHIILGPSNSKVPSDHAPVSEILEQVSQHSLTHLLATFDDANLRRALQGCFDANSCRSSHKKHVIPRS